MSITLYQAPTLPPDTSGRDCAESYKLDALMGGTPGAYVNDCDLTCPTGSTPKQSGAVAGPLTYSGQYAKRLYIEAAGTIVFVTATGKQDSLVVPATCTIKIPIAYIIAAGTTCSGIHMLR